MTTTPEPVLTLLICTYHREALLLKCLNSIAQLDGLASISYEVVVVDNSDQSTAADAVASVNQGGALRVKYVSAHPANISVARNAGIDHSRGQYIAMIDDDMTLDVNWLKGLLPYLLSAEFDVISGPVSPVYEDPALATASTAHFFLRDIQVSAPMALHITGVRRTRGFVPSTSNAIFRRAACFADGIRFDNRFGKSGGEDLDVFCRIYEQQHSFGWVPGVLAYEFVPAARCNVKYLKMRSFAGGQIYASIRVQNSRYPRLLSLRIKLIALAQNIVLAAKLSRIRRQHGVVGDDLLVRHEAIKGKLHWDQLIELYGNGK